MGNDISEGVMKRLELKDDQILRVSDSIDVKASIGLVAITFLATQTGEFLSGDGLSALWRGVQVVSAVALAVAGALVLWELWPRDYEVEAAESLEGWTEELREFYKHDADAEARVAETVRNGQLKRLKERIATNVELNERKSSLLFWSFRFTCVVVALNLATLIAIGVR